MCNDKQHTCNIAVGHRFVGYIRMFKAFYITQKHIAIRVMVLFYSKFVITSDLRDEHKADSFTDMV